MVNGWSVIKIFVFGGNYLVRGEFVLYINHSGKYIEINFNVKIPFLSTPGLQGLISGKS